MDFSSYVDHRRRFIARRRFVFDNVVALASESSAVTSATNQRTLLLLL